MGVQPARSVVSGPHTHQSSASRPQVATARCPIRSVYSGPGKKTNIIFFKLDPPRSDCPYEPRRVLIVACVNVSSDAIYLVPIQDPCSYDQGAYPDTGCEVQDDVYDEDYEQITQLRTAGRSSRVSSMQRVSSVSSSTPSMNSSRTLFKNSWTKNRI